MVPVGSGVIPVPFLAVHSYHVNSYLGKGPLQGKHKCLQVFNGSSPKSHGLNSTDKVQNILKSIILQSQRGKPYDHPQYLRSCFFFINLLELRKKNL